MHNEENTLLEVFCYPQSIYIAATSILIVMFSPVLILLDGMKPTCGPHVYEHNTGFINCTIDQNFF